MRNWCKKKKNEIMAQKIKKIKKCEDVSRNWREKKKKNKKWEDGLMNWSEMKKNCKMWG